MTHSTGQVGLLGEEAAARFLKSAGHQILQRNFKCPVGEIDLITFHEGTLVFVEVKALSGDGGDPEEHVNRAKQRKLAAVAEFWIAKNRRPRCAYRFDVVSVLARPDSEPQVRHIVEAFLPS